MLSYSLHISVSFHLCTLFISKCFICKLCFGRFIANVLLFVGFYEIPIGRFVGLISVLCDKKRSRLCAVQNIELRLYPASANAVESTDNSSTLKPRWIIAIVKHRITLHKAADNELSICYNIQN